MTRTATELRARTGGFTASHDPSPRRHSKGSRATSPPPRRRSTGSSHSSTPRSSLTTGSSPSRSTTPTTSVSSPAGVHVEWASRRAGGSASASTRVYIKTTCFEPFPFPARGEHDETIRALGEAIDAHRKARQQADTALDADGPLQRRRGPPRGARPHDEGAEGRRRRARAHPPRPPPPASTAPCWTPTAGPTSTPRRPPSAPPCSAASSRSTASGGPRSARGEVRYLRPSFQAPGAETQSGLALVTPEAPEASPPRRPWPALAGEAARRRAPGRRGRGRLARGRARALPPGRSPAPSPSRSTRWRSWGSSAPEAPGWRRRGGPRGLARLWRQRPRRALRIPLDAEARAANGRAGALIFSHPPLCRSPRVVTSQSELSFAVVGEWPSRAV